MLVGEVRCASFGCGRLLPVVRRQPVVAGPDELLEERPGAARERAEVGALRGGEPRGRNAERLAEPPGEQRRRRPRQQQRHRGRHGPGLLGRDQQRDRRGQHRRTRHLAQHPGRRMVRAAGRAAIGRGAPFEQALFRNADAPDGAQDRDQAPGRVVRQAGHREGRLAELQHGGVRRADDVVAPAHFLGGPGGRVAEPVQQRRHHEHADDRPAPRPGQRGRQVQPADDEQRHHRHRHQAAAQVVEQLPARQRRDDVRHAASIRSRHASPDPGADLPVAAHPASATRHIEVVALRIVLGQLDVGDEAGTCVRALEQVVAEDAIRRQPARQREAERVDVIDPLADERAFAEQVLVDVGDRARVRIDAGLAGEHPRVARAARARQPGRHARLQDAVAVDDAASGNVVARHVQRMRHAWRRAGAPRPAAGWCRCRS